MSGSMMLALRSLRARRSRTFFTAAGIVLGVAMVLAISIANHSTLQAITALFSGASGKAHLVISSSDTSGQGFSESALRRIASVPGVQAAVPSVHVGTLLADSVAPDQVGFNILGEVSTSSLLLYGIDPILDHETREYKVVRGEFLSPSPEAHDVVLVDDFAEEEGLSLGDDVYLMTPEGVEVLRIVGLMSQEGPGQLNSGAFGVVSLEVAQKLFARVGDLDQIDIVAAPQMATGAQLEVLKAALQQRLGNDYSVVFPAAKGKRVVQMLDVYQVGLGFFSVIALFVGTFLIYNSFSMTVVERTREIGMLRALGMTRRQIVRQILAEASILGTIGAAAGVGFGILLSQGLIRVMERLLAQDVSDVPVPLTGLATSVLVGLGATMVAALLPAWQAGRISPLEAMRIRGSTRGGWALRWGWVIGLAMIGLSVVLLLVKAPLPPELQEQVVGSAIFPLFLGATLLVPVTVDVWERLLRPWFRRFYGNEGEIGSTNIQRAPTRTTLTVAALMVGVAMILSIQAMTESFKHDIEAWIDVYLGGDLYVHSSMPMRADFGRRLEAIEGAAAVTPLRYMDVQYIAPDGTEDQLSYMALDPVSYPKVTSFTYAANQGDPTELMARLAEGDAVFISSVVSERYGLNQGGTIRLRTGRGRKDFYIAAVVVDFWNQGLVVEGSWSDMRRYFGYNDVSAFLVRVGTGYSVAEVEERIDRFYGERRHLTMESNSAIRERALGLVVRVFSLFDVVALIGMIVASLGVVNTMTMNVLERTQEIGMLRGLGMTRRQVGKMILAEAGMMGTVGGVFGIGFGVFLSYLFLTSPATMQGYELTYILPVVGILVSLIGGLLLSHVAAIWPARSASAIRIVEAIQYE